MIKTTYTVSSPHSRINTAPLGILTAWFLLRVSTLLNATISSLTFQPTLAKDAALLDRVLLDPWYRYDAVHFCRIIKWGYQNTDASANFHPLFPLVSMPFAWVTARPLLGLLIVATTASLLLLVAFRKLALVDLQPSRANLASALFICWPASLVLFAPYTEALWLLLAVLCFVYARRGRWMLAGMLGGLAALTRQQGIFLILPVAVEIWEASGRNLRHAVMNFRNAISLAFIPLGYAIWIGYRALFISDFHPDLSSFNGFVYSVMTSPAAGQLAADQRFLWPWQATWKAAAFLWNHGHLSAGIDITLAILFVAIFLLCWRHLRLSYLLYSLVIVLVSLSYYTGAESPYMGFPRHLLLAFPVFIGFASKYSLERPIFLCTVGALCQTFLLWAYVWESWVL